MAESTTSTAGSIRRSLRSAKGAADGATKKRPSGEKKQPIRSPPKNSKRVHFSVMQLPTDTIATILHLVGLDSRLACKELLSAYGSLRAVRPDRLKSAVDLNAALARLGRNTALHTLDLTRASPLLYRRALQTLTTHLPSLRTLKLAGPLPNLPLSSLHALSSLPSLTALDLSHWPPDPPNLLPTLSTLPALQHLSLHCTGRMPSLPRALPSLSLLTRLTHLKLSTSCLRQPDTHLDTILTHTSRLPHLVSLDLHALPCPYRPPAAPLLALHTSLHTLGLFLNAPSPTSAYSPPSADPHNFSDTFPPALNPTLLSTLPRLPSLLHLRLNCKAPLPEHLPSTLRALTALHSLSLCLRFSHPLQTLITPHHTRLTELRLDINADMHDALYTFSTPDTLTPLRPTLRVLHLSVDMMAETCLVAICTLPHLRDLRLQIQEYYLEGWPAWGQLTQLSALEALDLLVEDSWGDLRAHLSKLTQLTSLSLPRVDMPHNEARLLAPLKRLQVLDISDDIAIPGKGLKSLRRLTALRELVVHHEQDMHLWLVPPPPALRRLLLLCEDVLGSRARRLVQRQQDAFGPFCDVETRLV